jgi:3-oxoacyl-[acyl-carrier protein] reductase
VDPLVRRRAGLGTVDDVVPCPPDPACGHTVAIVTGASEGAGRHLAFELALLGYAVVVVYLRDQHAAEAVVEEILGAQGTALAVRADLADALDVERVFTETATAFGGADVVVHTTPRGGPIVYEQAARRLHEGGAIVTASGAGTIPPVLAEALRARGITMNGVAPGLEPPGAMRDVGELVAILDRWRGGRPG